MSNEINPYRCVFSEVPYMIPVGSIIRARVAEPRGGFVYLQADSPVSRPSKESDYLMELEGNIGQRGWDFPLDGNIWKWELMDE